MYQSRKTVIQRYGASCCPEITIAAGQANTLACGDHLPSSSRLATISFPIQQYETAFCPCEALESGTLFPELVQ